MKCQDCEEREDRQIDNADAFDMEARLRKPATRIIDYCVKYSGACEDEYPTCEYRDIITEAYKLQSIKKLIGTADDIMHDDNLEIAKKYIDEILEEK